jgi:hypothetical protein
MRKINILTLLISVYLTATCSLAEGDGGYPAAFRLVALEARAQGLGGGYTAAAEGASAVLWNASNLSDVEGNNISSTYRHLSLDRRVVTISYARPLIAGAGVGAAWVNAGAGRIMGYDFDGNPTGLLTNHQNLFVFAFGRPLFGDFLRLGAAGRFYWLRLADAGATGAGLDLALSSAPAGNVGLAFKVADIFSGLKWYDVITDAAGRSEDIEPTVTFGGYFRPWSRLTGSAELEKGFGQDVRFHFGGEVWLDERLAVRAGYDAGEPALGGTITYPLSWGRFSLDYAYAREEFADGAGHTATLGFIF